MVLAKVMLPFARHACRLQTVRDLYRKGVSFATSRAYGARSTGPMPDHLPIGSVLRYQHRGRAYTYEPDDAPAGRGVCVAVVGASGNMGRQIATSIAAHRRDFAGMGEMSLQFVGRRTGGSLQTLVGLCSELRDGFDDFCPHLEITCDLEAVRADIIVMAAGATMSTKFRTKFDVARANVELFETNAFGLAKHNSKSLVFVVSNPVEYGVDVFLRNGFDPSKVLGTGAYLDSLRFRRELASELGLPRQHISGMVLGIHGLNCVPCWSTVNFAAVAHPTAEQESRLREMKEEGLSRLPKDAEAFDKFATQICDMVLRDDALAAAAIVSRQPADVRAALRRYISFFSGPIYPRIGIGEKVARLVSSVLQGHHVKSAAQIHLESGFLGIHTHAVGAPVSLSAQGASIDHVALDQREIEAIKTSSQEAANFLRAVHAIANVRKMAREKKR